MKDSILKGFAVWAFVFSPISLMLALELNLANRSTFVKLIFIFIFHVIPLYFFLEREKFKKIFELNISKFNLRKKIEIFFDQFKVFADPFTISKFVSALIVYVFYVLILGWLLYKMLSERT